MNFKFLVKVYGNSHPFMGANGLLMCDNIAKAHSKEHNVRVVVYSAADGYIYGVYEDGVEQFA